jgi:hypothetical protein
MELMDPPASALKIFLHKPFSLEIQKLSIAEIVLSLFTMVYNHSNVFL